MSEILLEKLKAEMKIEPEKVALSLENFTREYTEKLEREGAILGLSGGGKYGRYKSKGCL
jgi:NAD+ synthase